MLVTISSQLDRDKCFSQVTEIVLGGQRQDRQGQAKERAIITGSQFGCDDFLSDDFSSWKTFVSASGLMKGNLLFLL